VATCLKRGANDGLNMVHLISPPSIIFCFIKIQNGFTFLLPAYPGCPGKEAIKIGVYLCVLCKSFLYSYVQLHLAYYATCPISWY